MKYLINIIILTIPFVLLSEDYNDRLESAAQNYENRLKYEIISTPIIIEIDDFSVSIPHYQIIVRSMRKRISIKYISFNDIQLTFLLDIVITNSRDVSYLKKSVMIESTFKSMTFILTSDGTFYAEFDNKDQCNYYLNDLFDSELFLSIEIIKSSLCASLLRNLQNSMTKFVRISPYSKRELEFVLFNNAIINMSTRSPFMVSYRLNETFVIQELTFNNFSYLGLTKESDKTKFAFVDVDFTYLMTNITYDWFIRETDRVQFKSIELNDDNQYNFSKIEKGNENISMLISDLFIKTNDNRKR